MTALAALALATVADATGYDTKADGFFVARTENYSLSWFASFTSKLMHNPSLLLPKRRIPVFEIDNALVAWCATARGYTLIGRRKILVLCAK